MAISKSNPKIAASMKMKRVSDAMKPQKTAMAKRGSTLKEKASDLSKLCDVAVYMTAVGADGKIDSWPEHQQDLKSVVLKYKNLRRGLKDQVEKGSFSAEKGFLEIVEDREIGDLGFQDNCLGAKFEALNERIVGVMRKMMKMRDDGNSTFMELYKDITESTVEPNADQQQQKSSLNLNLDPDDLIMPTPKPSFEFDHYAVDTNDYLSLVLGDDDRLMQDDLQLQYYLETMLPQEPQEQQPPSGQDDLQFCDNIDDYLGWVLDGDDHNDLQSQSSNCNGATNMEGLKIDDHDDVAGVPLPSMDATDDDIRLLLSDYDIDMMQEDVQFCVNDLIDMLLQDPQQQPHSEFKFTILDLNSFPCP